MTLRYTIVPHGSPEYWQAVSLRSRLLRDPIGRKFSEEELLAENDSYHVTGWLENELVAVLIIKPLQEEKKVRIRQVAVEEKSQRQKIGSRLLRFAEHYIQYELQAESIMIIAREDALPFYLKHGYIIEGDVFLEIGLRCWKVLKYLANHTHEDL